jgi:hypothetical protein
MSTKKEGKNSVSRHRRHKSNVVDIEKTFDLTRHSDLSPRTKKKHEPSTKTCIFVERTKSQDNMSNRNKYLASNQKIDKILPQNSVPTISLSNIMDEKPSSTTRDSSHILSIDTSFSSPRLITRSSKQQHKLSMPAVSLSTVTPPTPSTVSSSSIQQRISLTSSVDCGKKVSGHRRVQSYDVSASSLAPTSNTEDSIVKTIQLKRALSQQRQEEDIKFLLDTIVLMEPFFSDNVPVMAYVVYRTLVHWQVFEKDDNKLLSKIISTIETAVQKHRDSNSLLSYWLSSTFGLYYFVSRDIDNSPLRSTFVERVNTNRMRFEVALKNIITVVAQLIVTNIQTSLENLIQPVFLTPAHFVPNLTAKDNSEDPMTQLTNVFALLLKYLNSNQVVDELKIQLFDALFDYLDNRLISSLLIRSSCGQGVQLKLALSTLEEWILHAAGSSLYHSMRSHLKKTHQVADILCLSQKETLLHEHVHNRLENYPHTVQ